MASNEERVFDFMAAAEETGKRLDQMARQIPGELRTVLLEEWRASPWLTELPRTVADARSATECFERTTGFLNRSVRFAGIVVCLASVLVPLASWGLAEWNLAGLRRERTRLERENNELAASMKAAETAMEDKAARWRKEIERLAAEAAKVKAGEGGIELVDKGGGAWSLALPADMRMGKPVKTDDGRLVIPYTLPR